VIFDVPFLHGAMWRGTKTTYNVGSLPTQVNVDANCMNGYFAISIVNPVVVSTNASLSSVYFNIWICAGNDFELSEPDAYAGMLFPDFPLPSLSLKAQIGDTVAEIRQGGGGLVTINPTHSNGIVMGEKINHFRTVLHRPVCVYADVTAHPTLNMNVWPDESFAVVPSLTVPANYYHVVSRMYFGWRGSLRYRFLAPGTNYINVNVDTDGTYGPSQTIMNNLTGRHTGSSLTHYVCDVEFPYYDNLPFRWLRSDEASESFGNFPPKFIGCQVDVSSVIQVYQSAGDDFSFVYLAPPPDYLRYPTSTTNRPVRAAPIELPLHSPVSTDSDPFEEFVAAQMKKPTVFPGRRA